MRLRKHSRIVGCVIVLIAISQEWQATFLQAQQPEKSAPVSVPTQVDLSLLQPLLDGREDISQAELEAIIANVPAEQKEARACGAFAERFITVTDDRGEYLSVVFAQLSVGPSLVAGLYRLDSRGCPSRVYASNLYAFRWIESSCSGARMFDSCSARSAANPVTDPPSSPAPVSPTGGAAIGLGWRSLLDRYPILLLLAALVILALMFAAWPLLRGFMFAGAVVEAELGTAALIGRFGKLGTVIAPPAGVTVTGLTDYAVSRATMRGISVAAIELTVASPVVVLRQSSGRLLYLSEKFAVVINPATGEVVTTYARVEFDDGIISILNMVLSK